MKRNEELYKVEILTKISLFRLHLSHIAWIAPSPHIYIDELQCLHVTTVFHVYECVVIRIKTTLCVRKNRFQNSVVHTAEKNSSGTFWNGNSNSSVLDRNGTERLPSHYPMKCFQNGQNSSTCAV